MDVKIKNNSATAMNGWRIEFDLAADITNIWNGVIVSHVGKSLCDPDGALERPDRPGR